MGKENKELECEALTRGEEMKTGKSAQREQAREEIKPRLKPGRAARRGTELTAGK